MISTARFFATASALRDNPSVMARRAWNAWYHCTCNTYGTWLRGDPRGWRARHHREHVEGDYKHPPPKGKYDKLHAYSKRLMKRDPVKIEWEMRGFVLEAIVERQLREKILVVCAALTREHLHVLARFPGHNPRHFMGLAKKHASHLVRQEGLMPVGGLWAKKGLPKPINDRAHQINAVGYILDHRDEGGATWYFKEGKVRLPRK